MRFIFLALPILMLTAPAGAEQLRHVALSGDRLRVDGVEFRLKGVDCSLASAEEELEAKRLITTMMRAPLVECGYTGEEGAREGDCMFRTNRLVMRPRSMVVELRKRNLCQPRSEI